MNLKFVSDGTPEGTHLINQDTGIPISGIQEAIWHATKDCPYTKLTITFYNVPAEIKMPGEIVEGQKTRQTELSLSSELNEAKECCPINKVTIKAGEEELDSAIEVLGKFTCDGCQLLVNKDC